MSIKISCFFLFGWVILTPFAASAQTTEASPNILVPYVGDMVTLNGAKLMPLGGDKAKRFLDASYTVVLFSAGWCPDCRQFSPLLVRAYDTQHATGKRFEVLLFPMDRSQNDLIAYMREERMRWPAVAFDKVGSLPDIKKYYSGKGIPCVTVIDPAGTVVLQSKSDRDGAEILKQLQELLKTQ